MKDGSMLALTTAAFYNYRSTAIKLINKGTDIDASINELKEMAARNIPYLSIPANKKYKLRMQTKLKKNLFVGTQSRYRTELNK